MTREDFERAVYFAVLLNVQFMPTLKGLERLRRDQRQKEIETYARRLAEHMLRSNLKPYHGPPAAPHTLPNPGPT